MHHLHLILLFALLVFTPCAKTEQHLQFVQIWFRHGERTPTLLTRFPTDPPDTGAQLPTKRGELTKLGIQQEFMLGQHLREIYGGWLGDYDRDKVRILAGEDNRTVTSGLAMLAGLFPPSTNDEFLPGLHWQPIPLHTRRDLDEVSLGVFDYCDALTADIKAKREYRAILEGVPAQTLAYLRKKTGLPLTDPKDYNDVIDALKTKLLLNDSRLPYPEWATTLSPNLFNLSDSVHRQMTAIMNESSGGFHANLVLSLFEESLLLPERKAQFISGHDTNLLTIGAFFNVPALADELCLYAAHLAIELWKDDEESGESQYTVRVFYARALNATRVELTIPGCGQPCSLQSLQRIAQGKRWSDARWRDYCGSGDSALFEATGSGILSGALLVAVALLVLTTLMLLYKTCVYRKQLLQISDPELQPLVK